MGILLAALIVYFLVKRLKRNKCADKGCKFKALTGGYMECKRCKATITVDEYVKLKKRGRK